MAALSLHYITLRPKQIGRGWGGKSHCILIGLIQAVLVFEMNRALMSWMYKRSANYLFTYSFCLGIKAG